jgi:uncharacterized protein (DUF924 family)
MVQDILRFWFGDAGSDGAVAESHMKVWFEKNETFDALIRENFLSRILQAGRFELSSWMEHPAGSLALILLCDQFPRNAFRGTALSFALDFIALQAASHALEKSFDLQVGPVQRAFFYLPLEHAEHLEAQKRSVEKFETLALELPPEKKELGKMYLDYAVRHREIIERFGRFPHRNVILGRESTPAEVEILKEPGSGF